MRVCGGKALHGGVDGVDGAAGREEGQCAQRMCANNVCEMK